ncbi:MAG TPA: PAS domain-containing protein [Streptosporangiaceae bacterium]
MSQVAGDGRPAQPASGAPPVAVFTLDPTGRVAWWSVTAARLFGHTAREIIGHNVCDVVLTSADHRQLVGQALAEVAAGRVWSATLAVAFANGGGQAAIHCEPLPPPDGGRW